MLFMTRKRFEEEVQRRMWEEDQKRDVREELRKLWGRTLELEKQIEELKFKVESGGLVKEKTVEVPCGPGPM